MEYSKISASRVISPSWTLINNIYSSNCKNILDDGISKYSLNNHYMIMAPKRMVNGANCSKQRCRVTLLDYTLATPENIFDICSQENFIYVLNEKSIDKTFEKFHIHLNHLLAKLISEKTCFVKENIKID